MYVEYNPSPTKARVGDCAVRAVTKVLGVDWDTAYLMLCLKGYNMGDMPSSNAVIDACLREKGYVRRMLPDSCPQCYTLEQFSQDHSQGVYIVGTGSHVAAVVDGVIYDSWDSSNEYPIYYWEKERK